MCEQCNNIKHIAIHADSELGKKILSAIGSGGMNEQLAQEIKQYADSGAMGSHDLPNIEEGNIAEFLLSSLRARKAMKANKDLNEAMKTMHGKGSSPLDIIQMLTSGACAAKQTKQMLNEMFEMESGKSDGIVADTLQLESANERLRNSVDIQAVQFMTKALSSCAVYATPITTEMNNLRGVGIANMGFLLETQKKIALTMKEIINSEQLAAGDAMMMTMTRKTLLENIRKMEDIVRAAEDAHVEYDSLSAMIVHTMQAIALRAQDNMDLTGWLVKMVDIIDSETNDKEKLVDEINQIFQMFEVYIPEFGINPSGEAFFGELTPVKQSLEEEATEAWDGLFPNDTMTKAHLCDKMMPKAKSESNSAAAEDIAGKYRAFIADVITGKHAHIGVPQIPMFTLMALLPELKIIESKNNRLVVAMDGYEGTCEFKLVRKVILSAICKQDRLDFTKDVRDKLSILCPRPIKLDPKFVMIDQAIAAIEKFMAKDIDVYQTFELLAKANVKLDFCESTKKFTQFGAEFNDATIELTDIDVAEAINKLYISLTHRR